MLPSHKMSFLDLCENKKLGKHRIKIYLQAPTPQTIFVETLFLPNYAIVT